MIHVHIKYGFTNQAIFTGVPVEKKCTAQLLLQFDGKRKLGRNTTALFSQKIQGENFDRRESINPSHNPTEAKNKNFKKKLEASGFDTLTATGVLQCSPMTFSYFNLFSLRSINKINRFRSQPTNQSRETIIPFQQEHLKQRCSLSDSLSHTHTHSN